MNWFKKKEVVSKKDYDEAMAGWKRSQANSQWLLERDAKTCKDLNVMRQTADNRQDIIIKLQAENMALRAKIPKNHTEPYQDPLGRWRDPNNHGYCMKRPDPLVEADKLRKAGGM